jgi:hypothetical protein
MKHYQQTYKDGLVVVHADGAGDCSGEFTLCGEPLSSSPQMGLKAAIELPGRLEAGQKITCPNCVTIITYCKTALLQEYN